ncbi:MAG: hypothetical protein J3Q66DRAFT_421541 [Benniella sp.]|nr:MAG: hypothetical protein J3Q66DRAFT_421541 [Benniella sp.]
MTAMGNPAVVLEGERIPLKTDISRCDPALASSARSWTVSLQDSQGQTDVKLADMMGPYQRDLIWVAHVPETQNLVRLNIADSAQHDFFIQGVRCREARLRASPPTAYPDEGDVDPSIPAPPVIDAPTQPTFPTPDSPSDPGTTAPNNPIPPVVDPAELPQPLNPPVDRVVSPSAPEPTPQPGPSVGSIFLKYVAAGAGILSTIGVGVGGLVGGAVGGTVGLVLGLVAAGVNTMILG